ncbi:GNAT family N-acetyltransferase [Streptomyces catenulae]|uniref:GNAT family N-acetyltransferase n=1 Tax=Streptomyces catenulae TaxID=66875 RepID=A0ABV2YU80_9ACTN|nr:GNAT family N-acetyltransferase [Streptomyces catenulae]
MSALHLVPPADDATLSDWLHVHNTIIPTHELSLDDARERAARHRLEVAYRDGELVGCSTVRPPVDGVATVIARVLAAHRGRGYGTELYGRGLDRARQLGARAVETVVLSSNEDGLRFALRNGFVETDRYLLPGDTTPWIDLRLT